MTEPPRRPNFCYFLISPGALARTQHPGVWALSEHLSEAVPSRGNSMCKAKQAAKARGPSWSSAWEEGDSRELKTRVTGPPKGTLCWGGYCSAVIIIRVFILSLDFCLEVESNSAGSIAWGITSRAVLPPWGRFWATGSPVPHSPNPCCPLPSGRQSADHGWGGGCQPRLEGQTPYGPC